MFWWKRVAGATVRAPVRILYTPVPVMGERRGRVLRGRGRSEMVVGNNACRWKNVPSRTGTFDGNRRRRQRLSGFEICYGLVGKTEQSRTRTQTNS